jgi:hypothetical protein
MVRLVTPILVFSRVWRKRCSLPGRDLPPKSLSALGAIEAKRRILRTQLSSCISNHACHDLRSARDFLRSYACSFFELLKEQYSNQISIWEWESDIAEEAAEITLGCWTDFNTTPTSGYWADTVRSAIPQHLGRPLRGQPRIEMRAPNDYEKAGIDLASASPLLKMALKDSSRPQVFAPIQPTTRKRIGRSISSERAARRMEEYIEQKGISLTQFCAHVEADPKTIYRFRKTGKVSKTVASTIAAKMGMSLDRFLE